MNKQLFLFLMLLPMVASAYDETDGKLYYNLNKSDNTASVTYKGRISQDETYNDCSGDIVIPNEVTFGEITYRVTSIGKAAFCQCKDLTSVTISNSVTSIASSAFSGCTGLSNVILGDNVTSIAISAFYGCESLTSLIIPKNVTSIGVRAFSGCNCLESVITRIVFTISIFDNNRF